jgi:hypothetical protein
MKYVVELWMMAVVACDRGKRDFGGWLIVMGSDKVK